MTISSCKMYALPASHPCAAVEKALQMKGIAFDRVDLLPLSQVLVGPLLWRGTTVPGVVIDGERLVGSRTIIHRLDELAPEPRLVPAEGELRTRVLDVERWGDEVLQDAVRRILDAGWVRAPKSLEGFAGDAKLPLPRPLLRPALAPTAKLMAIKNSAKDERARADVQELPAHMSRIDEWIGEGVLGGEQPNAADLQVGSSLRLLSTVADVRALIEGHEGARLRDLFGPPQAGEIPAGTLPSEWIPAPAPAAVGD
jgi:glutathione S-transferase